MIPAVPDPLHPAVVHFPVALLLLGAPLSLGAVFVPRLARLSCAVLVLGALGSWAAVQTGEREKRDEIAVPEGEGRSVLRRHEDSGESARNAALIAATFAAGAVFFHRSAARRGALFFAGGAAALALFAAWKVAEAGHTGGLLVYHHGVGLRF